MTSAAARAALGRVGLWTMAFDTVPFDEERAALAEVDAQGWPALWLPEAFGREAMAHAALALASTERITVATGIANQLARDPIAMQHGGATLADGYPGRFVLGVGVSHAPVAAQRGSVPVTSPVTASRSYLGAMRSAPGGPVPPSPAPLLMAALGPRMLALAAELTDGAHTYTAPVEHTAMARAELGPDPVLAVELKVVVTADAEAARRTIRRNTPKDLPNYRANLLRSGLTDADLEGKGSDRFVDAVAAWGDTDAIARRIAEHFEAGADHVCLQVLAVDGGVPTAEWRLLSEAMRVRC